MWGSVIDGNGRAFAIEKMRELHPSNSSRPPSEIVEYRVRNLGWAYGRVDARGIRLSWRPTFTTRATLNGIVQWLSTLPDRRVLLSSLRSDWQLSLHPSTPHARAHILWEFRTAQSDGEGSFVARRTRPEFLRTANNLVQIHRQLQEQNYTIDSIFLWDTLEMLAAGRYVIVHARDARAPLRLVHWGKGYKRLKFGLTTPGHGANFEDQPDRAYARWAAESYRQVLAESEPRLEEVEASTWVPDQGRQLVRYQRALIPFSLRGQGRCLLSVASQMGASDRRLE